MFLLLFNRGATGGEVIVTPQESGAGGWYWHQQRYLEQLQQQVRDVTTYGAELVAYFEFYPGVATGSSHSPAATAKMHAQFVGGAWSAETVAPSANVDCVARVISAAPFVEAEAPRQHIGGILAFDCGRPAVFASVAGAPFMIEASFQIGCAEGDAFAMAA